jgi:hypothetical protein
VIVYTKKFITLVVLCVATSVVALGQDGSDMNYISPEELTDAYIGRVMHIDFYRRSHGNLGQSGKGINIDSIELNISGKNVKFIEHREDDGFNNRFFQQYLESSDKKIRIRQFKLVGLDEKTVTVIAYFNIKPFEKEFVFKLSDIAQFLVKMESTK